MYLLTCPPNQMQNIHYMSLENIKRSIKKNRYNFIQARNYIFGGGRAKF